jgi:hypothetical protein
LQGGLDVAKANSHRSKPHNQSRPRIKIKVTPWEFILEIISLLGLLGAAYMLIKFWTDLPDKIPKHFGFTGEVDAWGDPSSLYFLLGVNLLMYIMMTIIRRFPHTFNYPVQITADNAAQQYQLAIWYIALLKAQVVWLFVYLQWQIIQVALGNSTGLGTWFIVVVILAFLLPTIFYVLTSGKYR